MFASPLPQQIHEKDDEVSEILNQQDGTPYTPMTTRSGGKKPNPTLEKFPHHVEPIYATPCQFHEQLNCKKTWEGIQRKDIKKAIKLKQDNINIFLEEKRLHEDACYKANGTACKNCHRIFRQDEEHNADNCIKCKVAKGCIVHHGFRKLEKLNLKTLPVSDFDVVCINNYCNETHLHVRDAENTVVNLDNNPE